jgi:3'-phosphoadenosine 5'-phosphosulfate sulfotransferase (PAPS reductase)/FAD synthetase
LDVKILKTKQRIREWYDYYGGDVYVSFSGGKDSTVLLHMARELFPDIPAVFTDTGLEFPEIREFVRSIENVTWLKPTLPFFEVVKKYGYPCITKDQSHYIYVFRGTKNEDTKRRYSEGINKDGSKTRFTVSKKWRYLFDAPFKISDQCCGVMKKYPFKKYEKKTGYKPIVGTMASESKLREKNYLEFGCNGFNKTRPMSTPMAFWNEQDVWDYIKLYNVPYSKIYDMGYTRTGCVFCMYGCHLEQKPNRFQLLKQTHPKMYEYCMKDVEDGGLGIGYVLDYIHVEKE